jgi:iron complex outermembrane receptor protein
MTRVKLSAAAAIFAAWPGPVDAQSQLPEVVVTAPSPVAAKPRPTPASASVPSKSAAPAAPATASPPAAPQVSTPLPPPGTVIVDADAFAAVSVMTATEIEARPSATLADTLATRPGISQSSFAAGSSRPVIRGLDNTRVRIQENGVGAADASTLSEDHAVPIDPFAADRVEVVRGPATLRYGSQAIGGVVAIENNRIPSFVPPKGMMAEIKGGLTSVDDGRDGGFSVTAGSGGFVLHADAYRRNAGDYATPRGRQANSFVESEGHALGGSFVWSTGFAGLAYVRSASLYGIPGGEEAETLRPRIDMEQEKLLAKGEWRVGALGIEAIRWWGGMSDYAHNEVITEDGATLIGTRFTNKESEGRVEVQHLPVTTGFGELRGAIGLQMGRKRIAGVAQDEPVDGLLDPARASAVAGFMFEELQVTRALRLQAAARVEEAKVSGRGFSDVSDPFNPVAFEGERAFKPVSFGAGLLYQMPLGVVARLNGQVVERAPEAQELFSKGVHEATGTFEIGNPNIGKEKARTIELGFKRSQGDFRFDTSVFHTKFDGFIFKRLTGETCDDTLDTCGAGGGTELDQVIFTQRDATFRGLELAAEYDVARVWRGVWGIDGQYDFVRATFSDGESVPRIPPHRLGGGLFYRDAQWRARVGLLHAFAQKDIGPEETPTEGYTLLNAELSYKMKLAASGPVLPEMRIGIRGDNLLNEEVRNHVSFKKDEVLQPGASVRLFGSIKLN